jgi:hypothetical protein
MLSLDRRGALRVDREEEQQDGDGAHEGGDQAHDCLVPMRTKVRPAHENQVTGPQGNR